MVQDTLRWTDAKLKARGYNFKYFAAVAKLVHTWRAHAKKISSAWMVIHRETACEDRAARYLPPIPISGRRGSLTSNFELS